MIYYVIIMFKKLPFLVCVNLLGGKKNVSPKSTPEETPVVAKAKEPGTN